MGSVEFGRAIAVPLKEAIRITRGVTLVGSLPVRGKAGTELRFNQGRGDVAFPGEVLFVGFSSAIYSWARMSQVMGRVIQKMAGGETEVEEPGDIDREVFRLGSIRFTENGQVPIIEETTSSFSTDNPTLIDLLKGIGIITGSVSKWRQQFFPERTSYAVFYPSRLLAAVACDLGSSLRIIPGAEEYISMFGNVGFGAMTLMATSDLQNLGEFATTPHEERGIVQRILSKYHPGYIIPERLAA